MDRDIILAGERAYLDNLDDARRALEERPRHVRLPSLHTSLPGTLTALPTLTP